MWLTNLRLNFINIQCFFTFKSELNNNYILYILLSDIKILDIY